MRAVSGNHHRGNEVMAGEEQDKSCLDGLFINFYQFVIRSFVCRLAGSAVALSYFSLPFFFCLLLLCCSFISVYLSLCLSLCLSVSLSFFYNLCFSFSDLCPSFVFFPQNPDLLNFELRKGEEKCDHDLMCGDVLRDVAVVVACVTWIVSVCIVFLSNLASDLTLLL